MAKIHSESIVIELSRITKEGQELPTLISAELVTTIEQVVAELVGGSAVVEVKDIK